MKMRPKQFYIGSMVLFMAAISFPLQVMLLYGHHWSETEAIFSKITNMNWIVILSLFTGAYLYFHASRLIVYVAPVILAIVAFNNYLVGQFASDFSLLETTIATAGMGMLFVPLAFPSSLIVLKDPKRRWWRHSKRVNARVAATINPFVGGMVNGHTFDISKSGAFVSIGEEDRELPKIGDTVRVIFTIGLMTKIRFDAVVVRISNSHGHYPRGVGVKFTSTDKRIDKVIKKQSLI